MTIAYDCLSVCKLLLCGDIETNPGPNAENLKCILEGQEKILSSIAELKAQMLASNAAITTLSSQVAEIDKALQSMRSTPSKNVALEDTLALLRSSVTQNSDKLVDLEDRSRRSNLVVFGISEAENETDADLQTRVISDVFDKKLGVTCNSVARIHRLGRKGVSRPEGVSRPVILYLQDFNEKINILKNAKKLKGTKIFIENDFSRQTLRKRKLLRESARLDKDSGKNVYLLNDKLHIDRDVFVWDDMKNARVKIYSTVSPKVST